MSEMIGVGKNDLLYYLGHRAASANQLQSVVIQLSVAKSPEAALSRKTEDEFLVAIPVESAEKLIASIQTAIDRLRSAS